MEGAQPEFLTVAEIADLLRLNQQTVRNWIDRGELPAVRVGVRRVRVRRSDLDALIAAGTIAIADAPNVIMVSKTDDARAQDPSADAWTRFGAAMAESSAAVASGDRAALAESLLAVAGAATALAEALAAGLRSD